MTVTDTVRRPTTDAGLPGLLITDAVVAIASVPEPELVRRIRYDVSRARKIIDVAGQAVRKMPVCRSVGPCVGKRHVILARAGENVDREVLRAAIGDRRRGRGECDGLGRNGDLEYVAGMGVQNVALDCGHVRKHECAAKDVQRLEEVRARFVRGDLLGRTSGNDRRRFRDSDDFGL